MPLPAPPGQLPTIRALAVAETLELTALNQRPDLAGLAAKIQAEQAALELAYKEYYLDVEVFGRYDTFWQPASTQGDSRGQVGVNLNIPLYQARRNAAVKEAQFKMSERRADYQQWVSDIRYEVAAALEQLNESRNLLTLYQKKFLPTAEQNVAALRANYDVAKATFLDLANWQRQLITLHEKQQEILTTYYRRLAELERVIGGPVPELVPQLEVVPLPPGMKM